MSVGYVYVLTNPSMPGLVKVGKTTRDPEQRALELWQTGVPEPFHVHHYSRVPDCHEAEARVHAGIEDLRVHGSREFYRADAARIADVVRCVAIDQINDWVSEMSENLVVVEEPFAIDSSIAHIAADRMGVSVYEIGMALSDLLGGQHDDLIRSAIDQRHQRFLLRLVHQ